MPSSSTAPLCIRCDGHTDLHTIDINCIPEHYSMMMIQEICEAHGELHPSEYSSTINCPERLPGCRFRRCSKDATHLVSRRDRKHEETCPGVSVNGPRVCHLCSTESVAIVCRTCRQPACQDCALTYFEMECRDCSSHMCIAGDDRKCYCTRSTAPRLLK